VNDRAGENTVLGSRRPETSGEPIAGMTSESARMAFDDWLARFEEDGHEISKSSETHRIREAESAISQLGIAK